MAKKIRFPLEMENGVQVRTLEELQENFSLESVMGYFEDGKLVAWLRARYHDSMADAIEALDASDPVLSRKICEALDVDFDEEDEVDLEEVAERNRKLTLLKNLNVDKKYFDVVDQIAFEQDDLYDLLDEDETEIYLCGERFAIPLDKKGMTYIGMNDPVVVINSKKVVDWQAKEITLQDVRYDDKYQAVLTKKEELEKKTEEEGKKIDVEQKKVEVNDVEAKTVREKLQGLFDEEGKENDAEPRAVLEKLKELFDEEDKGIDSKQKKTAVEIVGVKKVSEALVDKIVASEFPYSLDADLLFENRILKTPRFLFARNEDFLSAWRNPKNLLIDKVNETYEEMNILTKYIPIGACEKQDKFFCVDESTGRNLYVYDCIKKKATLLQNPLIGRLNIDGEIKYISENNGRMVLLTRDSTYVVDTVLNKSQKLTNTAGNCSFEIMPEKLVHTSENLYFCGNAGTFETKEGASEYTSDYILRYSFETGKITEVCKVKCELGGAWDEECKYLSLVKNQLYIVHKEDTNFITVKRVDLQENRTTPEVVYTFSNPEAYGNFCFGAYKVFEDKLLYIDVKRDFTLVCYDLISEEEKDVIVECGCMEYFETGSIFKKRELRYCSNNFILLDGWVIAKIGEGGEKQKVSLFDLDS